MAVCSRTLGCFALDCRRRAAAPFGLGLIGLALIFLMAPDAMNGALAQLSTQFLGHEIRIGVGGPLTTGSATFGVEMRQAVELAVAESNAAGGMAGARGVAVRGRREGGHRDGRAGGPRR